MIECILIITGISLFFDALLSKWGFWHWLIDYGNNNRKKVLFELAQCELCRRTHLAVLVTIVYGLFSGFMPFLILAPFLCSGLMTFKK